MRFLYTFGLLLGLASAPVLPAVAQQLDPSFAPSRLTSSGGGVFTSLKQPDGKVLMAGFFQLMNGQPAPMVSRLNADGSTDLAFRAQAGSGPNATVTALALQPDGNILVAGQFDRVNGQASNAIVRLLPTGARDATFTSPLTSSAFVFDMVRQADGKILVGGTTVTNRGDVLTRLLPDGTLDPAFAPVGSSGVLFS
ncbi:delta-60 repeat domain-containing protein, partial [Hymenobacter agri]